MPSHGKYRVIDKSKGPDGRYFYLIEEIDTGSSNIKKIYAVAEEIHQFWETTPKEEAEG